ncbi:hypothetical protein CANARDRAFT_174078 [[Candida] arabinofermentans NRRL YB-2248]|uniref:CS domain-containing protein n=1 Tax=[Candida] arabinofermentans NRRL YB-2248 TaxID=983967 RepID=A0A1E4T909_9ASCO|nr:hypothetical protein CANARDRAFT_174078 [[Candida] arabinofermentans NRRL YB-2248]
MSSIAPEVLWAQRSSVEDANKNIIYLTIRIIDPEDLKVELTSNKLQVSAKSEDQLYSLDLEFYKEIDTKKSKYESTGSHLFFIIYKKELQEEYWPRLTLSKLKYHYIKTDFDKWVDEDEQNELEEEDLKNSLNDLNGGFDGNSGDPIDFAKLAGQYTSGNFPTVGDQQLDQFSSSDDEDEEEVKEVEEKKD